MLKNELIYKYWLMKQINHQDLNLKFLILLYKLIRPQYYTITKSKVHIEKNKFVYYTNEDVGFTRQLDDWITDNIASVRQISHWYNFNIIINYKIGMMRVFKLDIDNSLLVGAKLSYADHHKIRINVLYEN